MRCNSCSCTLIWLVNLSYAVRNVAIQPHDRVTPISIDFEHA